MQVRYFERLPENLKRLKAVAARMAKSGLVRQQTGHGGFHNQLWHWHVRSYRTVHTLSIMGHAGVAQHSGSIHRKPCK